jgi:peptide-methionine (R)-S-oxide reductase
MKDMTDEDWKAKLTDEQYRVLRQKGNEAPGTGEFLNHDASGMYTCAACGAELFSSDTKYESTIPGLIGWPSFSEAASNEALTLAPDNTFGMSRTEVMCSNCGGHLGHLFDDPTAPNGKHFCINSVCLNFEEKKA